eukprot:scaffold32878_cov73-Cyclotella_meneghiniana.AAC.2
MQRKIGMASTKHAHVIYHSQNAYKAHRVSFFCLGSRGSEIRLDKLSNITIVCSAANCLRTL